MIIEANCSTIYEVRDAGDGIDHAWIGRPVRRAAGGRWVFRASSKPRLVRKACTKVLDAHATATEA